MQLYPGDVAQHHALLGKVGFDSRAALCIPNRATGRVGASGSTHVRIICGYTSPPIPVHNVFLVV